MFERSIIVKRQRVLFTRIVRKIAKPLCWKSDMIAMPRANGSRNKKRPPIKRQGILLINEIRIRTAKNVKKTHRYCIGIITILKIIPSENSNFTYEGRL